MKKALFATVLAIAGITIRTTAQGAATVEQLEFANFAATVFTTDFIPSAADPTCGVATTIFVMVEDSTSHAAPGGPEPDTFGELVVLADDTCSNTPLVRIFAALEDIELASNANRTSASLSADATVSNTHVELDVTWTATGGISNRQHDIIHDVSDDVVFQSHVNGKGYAATAEGSVRIDGFPELEISSDDGELVRASGGRITITHP